MDFLYLSAEDEKPDRRWEWLFSGEIAPSQTVTVPAADDEYFVMEQGAGPASLGPEMVLLVGSRNAVPELQAKSRQEGQAFFDSKTPPVTVTSEHGITTLTAPGKFLVRKIILEHL